MLPAHLPEQDAGLLVVIVVDAMVPPGGVALDRQRRLDQRLVAVHPRTLAVGPVGRRRAEVAVGPHLAVAVIAQERALRRVHRDVVEVDAETVALRIAVGEQPALQHFVRREAYAGNNVGRRERGLLDLGEKVVGPAVELHHADFDQRIVGLRPDLGHVEGIVLVGAGLGLAHDLDRQRPFREIAGFDRREEIAPVALAIVGDDRGGFLVGQVLDALLGAEVEFHPNALVRRVDHREGVAAEAMHVAEGLRDAAGATRNPSCCRPSAGRCAGRA